MLLTTYQKSTLQNISEQLDAMLENISAQGGECDVSNAINAAIGSIQEALDIDQYNKKNSKS